VINASPNSFTSSDYGPNPLPYHYRKADETVSAIYFDLVIDAGIDHKTIRNRFNAERFQRQYFD
jgi:hypothetical protein